MLIPRVSITDSTAESVAGKNNEKPGTAHNAKPKPVKALRTEARRMIVHNAIKTFKEVAGKSSNINLKKQIDNSKVDERLDFFTSNYTQL